MKKMLLLIALCFVVSGLFAQNADSLAVAKVVDSLIKVSRMLTDKREFDKALEVNGLAEKVAVEKWGAISIPYANVCANQGRIYQQGNQNQAAEKWLLQSLDMREKLLGKEHQDYAFTQNALGNVYRSLGNFEKAETAFIEASQVRKKIYGSNSIEYARTINNLALLYRDIDKYDAAENLFIESISIREKTGGKITEDYATGLSNLGLLYIDMNKLEKAEKILFESLLIREKTIGKNHKLYAESLKSIGSLYSQLYDFEKSELFYSESLLIFEKIFGNKHSEYAEVKNNLGLVYFEMGNYMKAESCFREAASIWGKPQSENHRFYASALTNLAGVYFNQKKYEDAKTLTIESISIKEAIEGNFYINYNKSVGNLAKIYASMGNYKEAEQLFLKIKDSYKNKINKEHLEYINLLSSMAFLYQKMEDFIKSEPYYIEALQSTKIALGDKHQLYANCLNNLAILYLLTKRESKALQLFNEAVLISHNQITNALHHLSEREIHSYLTMQTETHNFFLLLATDFHSSPSCYDNALFHKGFLQNAAIRVNRPVLRDSATTEQYYLFKSLHRRLAAEYAKPIAERKNVEDLENRANDIEKELARNIAGYGEALRQVKWQEVQAALKPDEAAIEFVHYRYWNKKETDSILYAALVLRPGMTQPQFIPLFEEKQLEALLDHKDQAPDLFYKNLYSWEGRGQMLHQLIWQPLAPALAGVKTVYGSPSGLLHKINLGAIPSASGTLSNDQYQMVRLSSTRQLVVASNVGRVPNPSDLNNVNKPNAALFGGIQYDMDSTAVLREQTGFPADKTTGLRGQLNFSLTDSTLRGGSWKYLPGSEKEVTDLEKIMASSGYKTQIFKGFSGSEARFKALSKSSPRVLHLATHGFFFPDPKTANNQQLPGETDHIVFRSSDHPLMRSGLVLAGGNHAWQTGKPLKPDMEDGILTAYEIAQMDLSGTELVVLSACETGLGDIKGSEGVYGLQRAFKIAGAKHILMSLWQVPDQQTARLMSLFYKNWLSEKMPVADALRAAQNTLRQRGYDPFYWAGFVLVE